MSRTWRGRPSPETLGTWLQGIKDVAVQGGLVLQVCCWFTVLQDHVFTVSMVRACVTVTPSWVGPS